jgi:uncharacterized membrane protein YccC
LHKFNETTKALRVSIIEERETLMESQIQANQALRESAESMAIQLQEASKHASSLHVKLVEQFIESLNRLQERLESDSVNPSPEVESLRESLRMIDAETEHIIQKLDALK